MSENTQILDAFDYEESPQELPAFASFGDRARAHIIDSILMTIVLLFQMLNFASLRILWLDFIIIITPAIYKIVLEKKYGATVGKLLMKIKVVNYNGNPITWGQSLRRYSFYGISIVGAIFAAVSLYVNEDLASLTSFFSWFEILEERSPFLDGVSSIAIFVSIIYYFFSEKAQCLHDRIAKTYCVKAEQ